MSAKIGDPCEAITAEFVWGVYRCKEPSVALAEDRTWGTMHAVCAEHSRTEVPA